MAIRISRHDADLLPRTDRLHDRIVRLHIDSRRLRILEIDFSAFGDPRPDDAVVLVARLEHLAADVRHGPGRLEQHQAVIGRGDVHAT